MPLPLQHAGKMGVHFFLMSKFWLKIDIFLIYVEKKSKNRQVVGIDIDLFNKKIYGMYL